MQLSILEQLNNLQAISGASLAERLNVSRTSIWKQIKQLQSYGVPIHSQGNKGYQLLEPFICLNEHRIIEGIDAGKLKKNMVFHVFSSIDSTNQFLKTLPLDDKIHCCLSETQTQGRGRFQREWFSPFGENIYFSMRYKMSCDLSKLSGLSLLVSLSIINTLKQYGIPDVLSIKWPNDILWKDKKLSGNLIEIMAETHAESNLIIGIGLNVNMKALPETQQSIHACSLIQMTDRHHDRNGIIALLIMQLSCDLERFFQSGFSAFRENWMRYDYFFGKKLNVRQMDKVIEGIGRGVSEKGELLLEDAQGKIHSLSSGDTSIGHKKSA